MIDNKEINFVSSTPEFTIEKTNEQLDNLYLSENENSVNVKNLLWNDEGKRMRRVYKRNVALCIIFSILLIPFYNLFWFYELAKESNALSKNDKWCCPAMVVFLSIITLGIYRVYWAYQVGKKHNQFYAKYKNFGRDYHVLYMVLMLINYVVPFLSWVCFGIMQAKVNEMIRIYDEKHVNGLYVRDRSIWNKPILGTIVLFIIASDFSQMIKSLFDNAFVGMPGNVSNLASNISGTADDMMKQFVQIAADEVKNADSAYMITTSIIGIVSVLLVLWWFKYRFKHSGYSGVLVRKNFWKACLFGIPGFLIVGLNCLGFDPQNFKFGIILLGFVPAFTEEIAFRGIIGANFMRIYNKKSGVWITLFVTSIIFGAVHILNVFAGADFGQSLFQGFYAFALGMLFAAVLLRTGNLWICIIIHGLTDTLALMSAEALEQGAVQAQAFVFDLSILPLLIISLFFIGYSIYLCRPKKQDEIVELWADKFGDAVIHK